MLIIQGDNDIQVTVKDAKILAKSNDKAQLHIVPKMNHVLKNIDSKNRAQNVTSYADSNLPISPELVDAMAEFIGNIE